MNGVILNWGFYMEHLTVVLVTLLLVLLVYQ